MSAKIIDGKAIAQAVKDRVKQETDLLTEKPGLAVVLVGEDPASQTYVKAKDKACEELGFYSEIHRLMDTTSEAELLTLVARLNSDPQINGLLVQLPLPQLIDEQKITLAIDPAKDVDGFHPHNTGAIFNGDFSGMLPCTPAGCLELIKSTGVELAGKKAVVVGRSNIVGKPLAILLLNENCTVNICHSRTVNLAAEVLQADLVVAAVGRPEMITGKMIKPGAIVIDVGINRVAGKLVGDVEFASAQQQASYISPVPGGVGAMTIAMLMKNTLQAKKLQS